MKRKLKLTSFAKITFAVLIILGGRYLYMNQADIKSGKPINIDKIIQKGKNIFNKTEKIKIISKQQDTVIIRITDSKNKIEINTSGKTVIKNKPSNINPDTLLFNISEQKIGKIIYTTK